MKCSMDRATLYRAGYRLTDQKGCTECNQPMHRHYESPSARSSLHESSLCSDQPVAVLLSVCAEYDTDDVKRTLCCTLYYFEDPKARTCLNDAYGCDRRMHRHPICELGYTLCEFMRPDLGERMAPLPAV
jgi:hypothetical protein